MKFEYYQTPETRSGFEHRFHVLAHIMEEGKFHINSGISVESLMMVRNLPNGRIDFLSVDEMARLMANMMLKMADMPGAAPLSEEP
ncbi:AVAST type 1 anti-phage system protein Avs1c [Yersinia ruckeri]|uniref:AVAST type 1 anti-phage system protein Avs1c n=1 Tax=Yersinia ruckeri TaxID=29486 RepID=UPI00223752D7|nr:AVAST type 1 anti-phage system protein Avs1c [Yersinia ruckeri]MCW6638696.1 hypothetical protein [Yersinia ruckeri]